MAKVTRFNPPPNWPAPPAGWTPPPGWSPDPAWGPAPPNWEFWKQERVNPGAAMFTIVSAVAVAVAFTALAAVVGDVDDPAFLLGRNIGAALFAGVITVIIAKLSRRRWSAWVYPAIVLVIFLFLRFLSLAGQAAGS